MTACLTQRTQGLATILPSIDCAAECQRIEASIREAVGTQLRKRGIVLGVSGGIDSSVCALLAARALGPRRVRGLLMPERESGVEGLNHGRTVCDLADIDYEVVDITARLEVAGCYALRDSAVQRVISDFLPGDRFKITLADDVADSDRLNYFNVVAEISSRGGAFVRARMPADVYLRIVAATNLKQRVRKVTEYTVADELNYAVLGTPNLLEDALGFFVRGGDGLADLKPIAHLYKSYVFEIGRFLGLPRGITEQTPSTCTYSLPQTQQEFFFGLPYEMLDLVMWMHGQSVDPADAARALNMSPGQIVRIFRDIDSKKRAAARLDGQAVRVMAH
jgi:NAD+ synthase